MGELVRCGLRVGIGKRVVRGAICAACTLISYALVWAKNYFAGLRILGRDYHIADSQLLNVVGTSGNCAHFRSSNRYDARCSGVGKNSIAQSPFCGRTYLAKYFDSGVGETTPAIDTKALGSCTNADIVNCYIVGLGMAWVGGGI